MNCFEECCQLHFAYKNNQVPMEFVWNQAQPVPTIWRLDYSIERIFPKQPHNPVCVEC
jgi:hypothetical protein